MWEGGRGKGRGEWKVLTRLNANIIVVTIRIGGDLTRRTTREGNIAIEGSRKEKGMTSYDAEFQGAIGSIKALECDIKFSNTSIYIWCYCSG